MTAAAFPKIPAEDLPMIAEVQFPVEYQHVTRSTYNAMRERAVGLGLFVPVVPHLDARVLANITSGVDFDMWCWYHAPYANDARGEIELFEQVLEHVLERGDEPSCGTTACRAGHALLVAGKSALSLVRTPGISISGAAVLIYAASTGRVPDFFCDNNIALADIRACAQADPMPEQVTP